MASRGPLQTANESSESGGEQALQHLQVAPDSDSDGAAEPPLRLLAMASVSGGRGSQQRSDGADGPRRVRRMGTSNDEDDDEHEHCAVADATGSRQPLLTARESSDNDSDHSEYRCSMALATAGDHVDQPCMLATASDEGRSADEGASGGPPPTKRACCLLPLLPAAISEEDVQSMFFWPRVTLNVIAATLGHGSVLESCLFEHRRARMSTHFSGLGSAEMAWCMVRSWARMIFGRDPTLEDGWACERSRSLQQLLRERCNMTCVFQDIMDRLPDIDDKLRLASTIDYPSAKAIVMQSRVVGHARCATHGGQCSVSRTEVNVSGSSRKPWSKARAVEAGRARRQHKDVLLLLSWCRIIREDKPEIVIHENVRGFDAKILEELLGDMYDITTGDVSPQDLGFSFIARPRVYSVLTLRGRIVRTTDAQRLYKTVAATAARAVGPLPSVLTAGVEEVLAEENRVRACRGMSPLLQPSQSWRYLLTNRQAGCLMTHEKSVGDAHLIGLYVDLAQTVAFARPSRHIPTKRRSASCVWSWKLSRWLVPSEYAASMGFPIHPWCAQASGVPTDTMNLQAPTAIGNAMHVANVGCVLACALAACRRVAGHG